MKKKRLRERKRMKAFMAAQRSASLRRGRIFPLGERIMPFEAFRVERIKLKKRQVPMIRKTLMDTVSINSSPGIITILPKAKPRKTFEKMVR